MRNWHPLILLFIIAVIILLLYSDCTLRIIDYVSVVGSVASIYAIIIAIVQIKSVKEITENTNNTVNDKLKEIRSFLTYAEIERHQEMCASIVPYLNGNQYEAAALMLLNVKKLLFEIKNSKLIKGVNSSQVNQMIMRLGNDIIALHNIWSKEENVDISKVIEHVNDVSTYLQDISAKIKNRVL